MSDVRTMPAGLLLDCRTDLLERLQDPGFRDQVAFLLASQAGQVPSQALKGKSREEIREKWVERHRPAVATMANHLRVGEVYRVSPDMTSMVVFAASQLDASDVVDRSLAPTQCGIVRFDQPLKMQDIRGKTMLINWLVWGPYRSIDNEAVTTVWAFNDTISNPDDAHREMLAMADRDLPGMGSEWYQKFVGRFATVGCDFLFDGSPLGEEMAPPSPKQMLEVLEEGVDPHPGTNSRRYIHALWLLLNQTVTKIETEEADRPARRRAGKAKLPAKVTVIRLRREVSTLDRVPGESQVQWQHRWIVRGHWRWQACGAGRAERRRIWINPFVKGPESAPFVQSEKIYSLDR